MESSGGRSQRERKKRITFSPEPVTQAKKPAVRTESKKTNATPLVNKPNGGALFKLPTAIEPNSSSGPAPLTKRLKIRRPSINQVQQPPATAPLTAPASSTMTPEAFWASVNPPDVSRQTYLENPEMIPPAPSNMIEFIDAVTKAGNLNMVPKRAPTRREPRFAFMNHIRYRPMIINTPTGISFITPRLRRKKKEEPGVDPSEIEPIIISDSPPPAEFLPSQGSFFLLV